jgi:hypothetical protein
MLFKNKNSKWRYGSAFEFIREIKGEVSDYRSFK